MKLLLITLFVGSCLSCKAQLNELNKDSGQIQTGMTLMNGEFEKSTYTDDGLKMITYSFGVNNKYHLISAYFIMSPRSKCIQFFYLYQDDSMLEPLVDKFKADTNFRQLPYSLSFYNKTNNFSIKFTRDNGNLVMAYSLPTE